MSGPEQDAPPAGRPQTQFARADLDLDSDVEMTNYRAFESFFATR